MRGFSGRVNVLGCDERFWKGASHAPQKIPGPDEVVLNEALAKEVNGQIVQAITAWAPNHRK